VSRLAVVALAALVAVAALAGLVAVLGSRDDAGLGEAPGRAAPADPSVPAGSIVLSSGDPAALRPLADEYADPAGGPAVTLRPVGSAGRIVARARARRLDVADPDDPALRAFIEYWLGR
jgi:hypothetical protein